MLAEAPLGADRTLGLHEPDHGRAGVGIGFDQERKDVQLGPNEARRPRFDERRQTKLQAEALFRQGMFGGQDRRARRRRVEHRPRREVDAHVAQVAQKVMVLPADDPVHIRLDRVELGAESEPYRAELRRFHLNDEGHRPRRGIREGRHDVNGAEDFEIQERLRARLDVGGGVGRIRLDAERPPQDRLVDLLGRRTGSVRVESGERNRTKDRRDARRHGQQVVDGMRRHVGFRAGGDTGVRVTAIGEGAHDGRAGRGVSLFVEARALR